MTINNWINHLTGNDSQTLKYLPMELLNGVQTGRILQKFPENNDKINWGKLDGWAWSWLLRKQP